MNLRLSTFLILLFFILTAAACSNGEIPPSLEAEVATASDTPIETSTQPPQPPLETPFVPSATPAVPLAALVNGEGILLEDYESELTRFKASSGTGLATYGEERVLEEMIDQVLLAQAADDSGFIVDEAVLQEHILALGLSDQALSAWKTDYGYSDESFQRTMKWAIASAWMRDQIIAKVPDTAEQVHARQILLYNSSEAENVYTQLEVGTEFGTLAKEYDPLSKGELGWFPRGYLLVTELDGVLFTLEPGEYSAVIQTPLGYHIVQVLEKDPNYPLTADTRRVLQIQALKEWLENRRNQSEIVILLP
jgi:peptidyl-prolyl cis-trans isomerase C